MKESFNEHQENLNISDVSDSDYQPVKVGNNDDNFILKLKLTYTPCYVHC